MNQSGNTVGENASLQRSTTPQTKREYHLVKPDATDAVSFFSTFFLVKSSPEIVNPKKVDFCKV